MSYVAPLLRVATHHAISRRAFECRRKPLMRGGNHAKAIVLCRVILGDHEGTIGGAVVPQHVLKVALGLCQDAFDRGSEILLTIVDGSNECDRNAHVKALAVLQTECLTTTHSIPTDLPSGIRGFS
ncbi:hypothetical protein NDI38_25935 [Stenomitos frigidus AS-A4]|uniref:Uncharacterized protein n=1 Tax=Stenomitos frigidus AS-A4 TaxID=2933935 RepID=A0ABV0KS26_9CYAN